eukprot:scaffold102672_cov27-Tisochrysis_lutea.AAC.3
MVSRLAMWHGPTLLAPAAPLFDAHRRNGVAFLWSTQPPMSAVQRFLEPNIEHSDSVVCENSLVWVE